MCDDRGDHAAWRGPADRWSQEKLLAALRGGIQTVIIPHENERDLVEMPKTSSSIST